MANESATDRVEQREAGRYLIYALFGILLTIVAVAVVIARFRPDGGVPGSEPAGDGASLVWPVSTPEEQEMDPALLEEMVAFIDRYSLDIHSLIVVRHGHTVFERYGRRDYANSANTIYSVTKSVTSLLVGIALDQGYIASLDTPVSELLPDHDLAGAGPGQKQLTLEHLLTMTAGMDWPEHDVSYDDLTNITRQMWNSADPAQFVLDQPQVYEPGLVWAYNTGASILLGAIVEEATGRDLLDYANEVLFEPIGIDHVHWPRGAGDYYDTGGGLQLEPQEMARIGYLMLHGGQWQGRQVVPAEWVSESTAPHVQAYPYYDYGYQWWVQADGQGFEALGLYGQEISVLPAADMVVVITSHIDEGTSFQVGGLVQDFILPACSDLPQRPETEVYERYGVSFVYPGRFSLVELPFPGRDTVSEEAGIVQLTSTQGFSEIFSLLWSEPDGAEDEQALLELYLDYIAESEESFAPGDYGQSWKDGQQMPYRFFELSGGETTAEAVSGVWICAESGRMYGATYLSAAVLTADELLAEFEELAAGTSCP